MPRFALPSGVSIFVDDRGAGTAVVLLAGFGFSHEVWDSRARSLARSHRVLAVDLRGTGASDKPRSGYDVATMADDVRGVLDALDVDRVVVIGWSLGGQIGMQLASTSPDRVAGLALVCSNGVRASRGPGFPHGQDPEDLLTALVKAERNDSERARRETIRHGFAASPDTKLLERLVEIQRKMPTEVAVQCFETYLRTDLTGAVDSVRCPLLQVMGDRDPVTPLDGAEWVSERVEGASLVVLPDCGHYPLFEAPAALGRALEDFLSAVA